MSEQAVPIDPSQDVPQPDHARVAPQSTAPYRSRWSRFISTVCAGILIAALGTILWSSATVPKLDRFEHPDQALELMVGRMMEAQDGLLRSPKWHQKLVEWTSGSNDAERAQAIDWYRELVQTTQNPISKLRLAILLGESGRPAEALTEAQTWQASDGSMTLFGQLIHAAYGDGTLEPVREAELQASLAEILPNGWFYNHLAARLADRAGDAELLSTLDRQIMIRGTQAQRWTDRLVEFELVCLIIGSVMLVGIVYMHRQGVDMLRLHLPGIPPPWSGETGAAVLLRGGALGAMLTVAFLSVPSFEHVSLRALAIPVANVPLLALAYVQLLKPAHLSFRDGFGLRIDSVSHGRLIGLTFAVIAAGLWGEWVMGRGMEVLGLTNHWTEWFDPDLVWAPPSVLGISLLEYVVFAPIFEELAFRGIFYAMLRRRFSFLPAALISTSVFALAHGYGLIGFISVLWSGFLWAWIYERTGSLIPGMIAHATNNLLVCLMVMSLLR